MITGMSVYWGAVFVLVVSSSVVLSDRGCAQALVTPPGEPTNVDQWQTTDLSILDFVTDVYDLVSVISASRDTRLYFLSKPGKIVKCREGAIPNIAPPTAPGQVGASMPAPPPISGQIGAVITAAPLTPGQVTTSIPPIPPPPPPDVNGFRTEFECAVLLRGASRH